MAAVTDSRVQLPADERAALGKAARRAAPRSAHGDWGPAPDRRDPVDVLAEQATSRVPELVPIRHGRMLASPFAFFRGAAAIMAGDLAGTPDSGIQAQLCGDAHLANFGVYAAPDRRLVFDLNDFDESHAGPWEWDVKRLAASLEIAGRDRGFRAARRRAIVRTAARAYREAMRQLAAKGNLAVFYERIDVETYLEEMAGLRPQARLDDARRAADKARRKNSERALLKLTEHVDGELRFRHEPPLLMPLASLTTVSQDAIIAQLSDLLATYTTTLPDHVQRLFAGYRPVDFARKVVGVGSVGTRAWVILLEGRDAGDPLVLQAKEAQASVLETYLQLSEYENHGRRVVEGQRAMQTATDILLGWIRFDDPDSGARDFYVRQLWDGKGSLDVADMAPDQLRTYGSVCAWTLARAHARSGDRIAIAAYLGGGDTFDRAIEAFADRYADQNERDFGALEQAVDDGRLDAQTGL